MTRNTKAGALLLLTTALLASGCGDAGAPGEPAAAEMDKTKYLLAAEPADPKGVLEVRERSEDGNDVVVVGRIGGSEKPFTGRASFTIVDPSLPPCEGEEKPWTYCCTPREDLAKATVLVKFVDDGGKTLPDDAREAFDLKELQTVVVRGKAKCDSKGYLTAIEAEQLYVKP